MDADMSSRYTATDAQVLLHGPGPAYPRVIAQAATREDAEKIADALNLTGAGASTSLDGCVARGLAEAERRDLFHTTDDGYDVGHCVDPDDIEAILAAAGFDDAVALLERALAHMTNATGAEPVYYAIRRFLDAAAAGQEPA